jgi:transposase
VIVSDATVAPEIDAETLLEKTRLLEKQLAVAHREIDWLRERLLRYMRRTFGSKAEKIDLSQIQLPFEELLDIAAAEKPEEPSQVAREAADDEAGTPTQKKRKGAHGRRPLPKDLPRLRVEIHPDPSERMCLCCKTEMTPIGEEVTEELDFQPATLTVTEHVRVKYACKRCQDGVVTPPLPPRVIEKGRPGPGLLAHILVSKYADHLPLYRLEGIFERHGIDLSRQTMCDWIGAVADPLSRIVAAQKKSVLESFTVHSDDTSLLCQENSHGGVKRRSFLWAYVGERLEVVYDFTLTRQREGPIRFLQKWKGRYLQVDGYSGYDELFARGDVTEVGCWAHVRRKYFDALAGDTARASTMLALIQRLYRIESQAKGLGPEERAALRRAEAPPILEQIRLRMEEDKKVVVPRSAMGEATTYAENQWNALVRYLEDGRLDIDNNEVERALRCVAVGRKNWLFAGSPKGGERAAVIYSLVSTCKLLGIEPFAYLRDVLERLPTHPADRIAELTPRLWLAARQGVARS